MNGLNDQFKSMDVAGSSRPPSLFSCQVKLFHDWFSGWSDDQKQYLVLRLQDIDPVFFQKYEDHMQNGDQKGRSKDYFEPGIPEELVRAKTILEEEEEEEEKDDDLKKET